MHHHLNTLDVNLITRFIRCYSAWAAAIVVSHWLVDGGRRSVPLLKVDHLMDVPSQTVLLSLTVGALSQSDVPLCCASHTAQGVQHYYDMLCCLC